MTTRIKLRRDTAFNWTSSNPILAAGEPGLETDTGKIKYGDGVTAYNLLPHAGGDTLVNDQAVTITAGDDTTWIALARRDAKAQGIGSYSGNANLNTAYDNAGNVVTLGLINQNNDYNIYVSKYTPAGVCLWKKSVAFVGPDFGVGAEGGFAIDSNNNIIVAFGWNTPGTSLLKISPEGETVWCGIYSDTELGIPTINGVAVDSEDNIFITTSIENEGGVIGVNKISKTTGAVLWSKQLSVSGGWQSGSSIAVDYLDNVIVTGYVDPADNNQSTYGVVIKLDSAGVSQWRKTLVMPDPAVDRNYAFATNTCVDALGNIYVTGGYVVQAPVTEEFNANGQVGTAAFIVKLNTSGVVQWSRRAGPGTCNWLGLSTTVGEDGDVYLAAATTSKTADEAGDNKDFEKGFYSHNLVLARYNGGSGDVVWQKYFNNKHTQVATAFQNYAVVRSIDVHEDKLVICGGSQLLVDYGSGYDTDNWATGWLAQMSTDGSVGFDLADFQFLTSRVPGRKINITTVNNTALTLAAGTFEQGDDANSIPLIDAPVSTVTIKSKSNTWTFDGQGNVRNPADGDVVLDQTELGYINFKGYEANYDDDIWFQSVVGDADGNTYAVGADEWNGPRRTTVHKFDAQGKTVWEVQLRSGSGSVWDISKSDGVYTIDQMTNGGQNYRVGDTIVISGGNLDGDNPQNNLIIEVTEVDEGNTGGGSGYITGYEIQSGIASAGGGTYYGREDGNDDGSSRPNSISIDPSTGNLVIIADTYEYAGDTSVLYLVLDSESGAVLSNKELHNPGIDTNGYDVQVSSAGVPAIVGQAYGITTTVLAEVTAVAGSPVGFIRIGKEVISTNADGRYPGNSGGSDWYITGTGISGKTYIYEFNYYKSIPVVTTQGSGTATFTIVSDGSGYTAATTVIAGGTGYVSGHKLKVLGSALGGVDGVNDAILQVIQAEAVTGVIIQADVIEGTAGTGSAGTYTPVASTNYQVGTGGQVDLYFDPITGILNYAQVVNGGSNYTVGDTLTIVGTTFAGSTSPTHDITLNVTAANGSYTGGQRGAWTDYSPVGTPTISSEYLSLAVSNYANIDFTGTGTWQLLESKNGEAFIWTPDFQKTFGGTGNDWFTTVAWQGTSTVFVAGASHNTVSNDDENIIVKMSSTGVVAWKKQITDAVYTGDSEVQSIGTHADGVVVVGRAYNDDEGNSVIFMSKLDNDGALMWAKEILLNDSDAYDASMAIDPATGDILVAIGGYNSDVDWDVIYLNKFDRDGNAIWKRILSSAGGDGFNWDDGHRALSIAGDKFCFAGWTYWSVDDYSNAWTASLPLDGTGQGEHGIWSYKDNSDNNVKTYVMPNTEASDHVIDSAVSTALAVNNARFYYTDYPESTFPVIKQLVRSLTGGALVFPDGSRQTTSAGISQQVRMGTNYHITLEDAGGHIFIDDHNRNDSQYVRIPYWEMVKLPVGFKFSIINRSDNTVYVYMDSGPNNQGNIYGVNGYGNFDNGYGWYIGGNNYGAQWVELMKVKEGYNVYDNNNGWTNRGAEWVIRGPGNSGDFGVD